MLELRSWWEVALGLEAWLAPEPLLVVCESNRPDLFAYECDREYEERASASASTLPPPPSTAPRLACVGVELRGRFGAG